MRGKPHLIYWDSSVILSYLGADPDRIGILDTILEEVEKSEGTQKIVTSILAKAEVIFTPEEYATRILDPETEKNIDAFWNDESVVGIVELHDAIVLRARQLARMARVHTWSLKPPDAIHLASAQWLGVAEIHTYDRNWAKFSDSIGCKIGPPQAAQPRLPLL